MKKIVLHGPAVDNAGNFCDAGSELEIGDKAEAGFIAADRARKLLDGGGAVSATAEKRIERDAAPDFDESPFNVALRPGGNYTITGPGIEAPEKVKGKAAMQARVTELKAALPPAPADAQDGPAS